MEDYGPFVKWEGKRRGAIKCYAFPGQQQRINHNMAFLGVLAKWERSKSWGEMGGSDPLRSPPSRRRLQAWMGSSIIPAIREVCDPLRWVFRLDEGNTPGAAERLAGRPAGPD